MRKQYIWFWFFCLMGIGAGNLAQTAEQGEVLHSDEEQEDHLELKRGHKLNGIKIMCSLGTGMYGAVYKGLYEVRAATSAQNFIAVKVSRGTKSYFDAAKRENDILEFLHQHRNASDFVVEHLRGFEHHSSQKAKHFCLVMEYAPKGNLYRYIKDVTKEQKLPLKEIQKIVKEILHGLDFLAKRHVIHADLKPENILVWEERVKIADFGCSFHLADAEDRSRELLQTLFYRSPEVFLYAAPYSFDIDMWSLGCMAVEMYIGRPLFSALNEEKMMVLHMEVLGEYPMALVKKAQLWGLSGLGSILDESWWKQCPALMKEKGEAVFGGQPLSGILGREQSDDFLQICLRMLERNPRRRISPNQALQSRFFLEAAGDSPSASVGKTASVPSVPSVAVLPVTITHGTRKITAL